jgi:hypothetical protein
VNEIDTIIRAQTGHAPPEPPTADERLTAALVAGARNAGLRHAEAVSKLADRSKIEFDESGKPTNIRQILDATAAEYPGLLTGGPESIDAAFRRARG